MSFRSACAGVLVATMFLVPAGPARAATTVGRIAADFAVSASGAATYRIPISVAAGMNGLKPDIALVYSSQSGDGLAGFGWTLTGFSQITRCSLTQAVDGRVRGVRYASDDRYCLDGAPLVLVGGSWGGNGAEYRTEVHGYQRIFSRGAQGTGPQSFEVQRPDGLTARYGTSADSRIEAPGTGGNVRVWALAEVEDKFGQRMAFSYTEDATLGEFVPTEIRWTYPADQGSGAARYRLAFGYEAKPAEDVRAGYVWGSPWRSSLRLATVDYEHDPGTGFTRVHRYALAYRTSYSNETPHSRLAGITQCGPVDCLPATTFTWSVGMATLGGYGSGPTGDYANAVFGDFDGDGTTDMFVPINGYWHVVLATTSGNYNPPVNTGRPFQYPAYPLEFNGDGRTDLLVKLSNGAWVVYESTGAATGAGAFIDRLLPDIPAITAAPALVDVDGDGLHDLVYVGYGGGSIHWRRNTGGAFGPDQPTGIADAGTTVALRAQDGTLQPADFDGDGREDLLVARGRDGQWNWSAYRSNGAGFDAVPLAIPSISATAWTSDAIVADVNGDGLSDLVLRQGSQWVTRISDGAAALFDPHCTDPVGNVASAFNTTMLDLNGDGRADLLVPRGNNLRAYLSDGLCYSGTSHYVDIGGSNPAPGVVRVVNADVDGDGAQDLLLAQVNSTAWLEQRKGGRSEYITAITDGLGNRTDLTYQTLSHWRGYTATAAAAAPTERLVRGGPMLVVGQYSETTGLAGGGTYTVTMSYADGKLDVTGRGFLGFASVRATDSRNGLVTESLYRQAFPFTGRLDRQTVWNGTKPVSVYAPEWGVYSQPAAPTEPAADYHFVYLTRDTREDYEADGESPYAGQLTQRTTRTLQQWNFSHGVPTVTQTVTESPESPGVSWSETRTATLNDALRTSQWCLGLPDRVTVTRASSGTAALTRSSQSAYLAGSCRVLTETTGLEADASQQLRTTYAYDNYGRMTSVARAPADGSLPARQTNFSYDATGYRAATEARLIAGEPAEITTRLWSNALGVAAARTDPQGRTTRWSYDDFGRLRTEQRPAGSTAATWTACGTCYPSTAKYRVRTDASSGFWSEAYFDARGRTVGRSFVLADGSESRQLIEYDALGRVSRETVPYLAGATWYWNTFAYDLLGRRKNEDRPVSEGQPSGAITHYIYGGLRTDITDAEQRTRSFTRDPEGRLTGVLTPLGGGAAYTYTAFGELAGITDAGGNVTTFDFDARGRRIALQSPDLGVRRFTWNAFGELVTQSDGRAPPVTLRNSWDQLGRLRQRTEPEGTTSWAYSTAPDASLGQLLSVTAPTDMGPAAYLERYTYDALGRPQQVVVTLDGTSYQTDYAYDAEGELARMTYPATVAQARPQFDYAYSRGYLRSISQAISGWGSVPVYGVTAQDALGRETRLAFGDAVTEQQHVYDAASLRMTGIRSGPGLDNSLQNYAYQWDNVGNLLERQDAGQNVTEHFTYDALDRLASAARNGAPTLAMTYSADGNILSKSDVGAYAYTGDSLPHAVRSIAGGPRGALAYTYDANGNTTSRGGAAVTWTSFNLPRAISRAGGICSGDCEIFTYGPVRQRLRQVTRTGSVVSILYYVAPHFQVENRAGVTTYRSHLFANGRVVYTQAEGTDLSYEGYYVLRDYQRSVDRLVRAVGANADGFRNAFDAWGKRRNNDWTADPGDSRFAGNYWSRQGYTGHEQLDNVRLIHMNARAEDPIIGRMLSPDPLPGSLLNPQSLNPYTYAGNNPTSYIDPSGLFLGRIGSFFSNAIHSIGNFVGRVAQRWGRTIVAAIAAYYTAGAVNDLYVNAAVEASADAGTITSMSDVYATALAAEGAAPNLLLQGIAGGAVGGAVATGSARGALAGAVTGGAFAGVDVAWGGEYSAGRVVTEGVVGGAATSLQGGDFWRGFAFSATAAGAEYGYRSLVKFGTDWAPGGAALPKRDPTTMPYRGINNFGEAVDVVDRSCWLCLTEGGRPSQLANLIPGMNAVAGMHDILQRAWSLVDARYPGGLRLRESMLLNVAGMPVSAAVTYPALLHGTASVWLADQDGP